MKLRIFIGSSGASESTARRLQTIIDDERDANVEVTGWWNRRSFTFGRATLESLEATTESYNAAILVAAPDDFVIKKEVPGKQTRDNVIFEYGLFCGAIGRERVLLCTLPDSLGELPMLPTDLNGIMRLDLQPADDEETFCDVNRAGVRGWLAQLRNLESSGGLDSYPRLASSVDELVGVGERRPHLVPEIDRFGSELLTSAARLLDTKDYGFAHMYGALLKRNLRSSTSIYALDVLGPSAWIGPMSFRYLSVQLWQYIRANTIEDRMVLRVSQALGDALNRSLAAAIDHERHPLRTLDSSLTDFDSKAEIDWRVDKPVTEYARILLWSRKELTSPIADSVIAIHEAFHVPLFFLETDDLTRREYDYLLFRQDDTDEVFGFVSRRAQNFQPESVEGNKKGKPLLDEFRKLLGDEQLMFALDARHYYGE